MSKPSSCTTLSAPPLSSLPNILRTSRAQNAEDWDEIVRMRDEVERLEVELRDLEREEERGWGRGEGGVEGEEEERREVRAGRRVGGAHRQ